MRHIAGWGVWHKRAIVEEAEHGLQVGEVSSSCWYHQSGVEQFSVELLNLGHCMSWLLLPLLDCLTVFVFFC